MSSSSPFSSEKSLAFYQAAKEGNLRLVQTLSRDPEVDLNWKNETGWSPFWIASSNGHVGVVRYLLGFHGNHREINYNSPHCNHWSPLMTACVNGRVTVVEILLADERIDVNLAGSEEETPFWRASQNGHVGVVKRLLASGRQIDTKKRDTVQGKTAEEMADLAISPLIREFEGNPNGVRERLRKELRGPQVGELFALIVFFSDGYLQLQPNNPDNDERKTKTQRFFTLAQRLPMELQMVLSNRVFGIKDVIVNKACSERGFRKFARIQDGKND